MTMDVPGFDAPLPDVPGLDAPLTPDAPLLPDVPLPVDAPLDVPRVDAPVCVPGCRGEVADDCMAPRDCAAEGLACRTASTGPECVCADAPPTCEADGRAITSCMSGVTTTTYCGTDGCRDGDCNTSCNVPLLPTGSSRVDLCAEGSDNLNQRVTGACPADAGGDDILRRIELPVRSRVTVTVRDDDPGAAVDTMVYVRGVCDTRTTQIACSDDVPCGEAEDMTGCFGGRQWRESRVTLDLDRGAYFVIADSFADNTNGGVDWTCGFVEIVLEITPL